ncbi:SMP-30/gluconolactonase/LRE family protein [Verticiella sediminum]|uniref:SMP-30/gluconolactonase/LRE family protein n=1 Tax=Verticiella sediminum TaxID=1247510 RepID=A0A556A6M2_9BURK|nr:SMP-30/gluconolactonase/LRE family protein [Verticiella sediminum]
MTLELVAEGLQFPEGPVAMADGSVLFTEIRGGTVSRVRPGREREVVAELGGGPNGLAIGPDGALYVTNNGGSFDWIDQDGLTIPGPAPSTHEGGAIQRLDLDTGKVRTLYTECDGHRLIGPNDLVFDRQGGFWFTDHGSGSHAERRFGRLYYALPDGSRIVAATPHLLAPNGVGLSPDEKTVYVADTYLGRLWAFDIVEPGVVRPVSAVEPGRVVANLQGVQYLDSLAVEAEGNVCVATLVNGGLTIFDPHTGGTEHLAVPDMLCTNLCFGGPDMRDAWITASGTGRLYKTRWPRPGLRLNYNA